MYLKHYGILGMKWGERRYQNKDGTLTPLGREHYGRGAASVKRNDKFKIAKRVAIGVGAAGLTAALGYGLYSGAAGRLITSGARTVGKLVNKSGLGNTAIGKGVRNASKWFAKAGVDVSQFGLTKFKPLVDAAAGAVASGAATSAVVAKSIYDKKLKPAGKIVGDFVRDELPGAVAGEAVGEFVIEGIPTAAVKAYKKATKSNSSNIQPVGDPVAAFGNRALTFITDESGQVVPVFIDINTGKIIGKGDTHAGK